MQKFPIPALVAATLIAGCASAQKSPTWQTVKAVRHPGPAEREPAAAYATKLHRTLQGAGVAHKVVTLKFRYDSRILLYREAQETAVIYRDSATPAHPWWLMAERLSRPVWLPCAPVASQAAFYLSRPVSVIRVEDFPAKETRHARKVKHDGKTMREPLTHPKKSGRTSHKPR